MTVIPNFILKRMYRAGSLRQVPEGAAFDIINNLGPGQITQLNSITLNGVKYTPDQIVLRINEELIPSASISEQNPATFFLNQTITCIIHANNITPGKYEIVMDLVSREAGKVTLSVEDQLAA